MRTLLFLALLALPAVPSAFAGDPAPVAPPAAPAPAPPPPTPLTPEAAAHAVLAAVKAKDGPALNALALKDDPDPWLVADELIRRGEFDAADAFAKAAPRKAVEKLPDYVVSRRAKLDDPSRRTRIADGNAAYDAAKLKEALQTYGDLESTLPEDVTGIRLAFGRGLALMDLGRCEESAAAFQVAANAAQRAGWHRKTSGAFINMGNDLESLGQYPRAAEYYERGLNEATTAEVPLYAANALANLGLVHDALGNFPKALECQERALKLKEGLGDRAGVARILGNIGVVQNALGNYPKALEYHARALKMQEDLGDRGGIAAALINIGAVRYELGDYAKALEFDERGLDESAGVGQRVWAANALVEIGLVEDALGNFPKALEYQERALGMKEEFGDRRGVAEVLINIGNGHFALGDSPKALAYYERALKTMEDLGDRAGAAKALGNLGNVHDALGNYSKALEYQERALKIGEDIGDRAGAAGTLGNIGALSRRHGDLPKALKSFDRTVREAERLRSDPLLGWALRGLAVTQLAANDPVRALASAKRAIPPLERMLGGLGEEQGAGARGQHATLFGAGALAAARTGDAAEVAIFLESGRAGSLMESLAGKQAMRWQSVPAALHAAQIDARAAEGAALAAYTRTLATNDRAQSEAASKTLDAARESVKQVIERIQREVRREADIWYPRAATMEEIQKWMGEGDALVLYAFCMDEVLALVITRAEVRIVSLGKVADVTAACDALQTDDRDEDAAPALAALRKLLLDPLKLADSTKRLLISPEGPLSYVPFAAIATDRTVVYEPSGTTYGLLLEEAKKRGEGVLAIGDPDYAGKREGPSQAVYWRGRPLVALPETRAEAKRVGDVSLLGADASEGGLRAALPKVKGGRWRAVHFACHGLIDVERPTLSSLALSRDAENDGFLTALEVLDLDVPADLAVLSACETGKGKIVKGEGIVGLTRAFMYAGAPRVICSLWKVDDEATRALMTKFYELWNPKDGKPGLPTAEALRKAQDFVRDDTSHPTWKHPYYWAAWVLWGLGD